MPYSMTIPYVLALFRLHLQYAKSIDLENLEGYLQQIDDNVASLDRLLENNIARGNTMIQNAFTEAKRNLGQMRGALAALRAVPQAAARLKEAGKLGFTRAVLPELGRADAAEGLKINALATLSALVAEIAARSPRGPRRAAGGGEDG